MAEQVVSSSSVQWTLEGYTEFLNFSPFLFKLTLIVASGVGDWAIFHLSTGVMWRLCVPKSAWDGTWMHTHAHTNRDEGWELSLALMMSLRTMFSTHTRTYTYYTYMYMWGADKHQNTLCGRQHVREQETSVTYCIYFALLVSLMTHFEKPLLFFFISSACLCLSFFLSSGQHQCLQGAVCPVAAASTAYCGSCDLDPSMTACTWVLSAHTELSTRSTTRSPFISTVQEALTTGPSTHSNRSNNTYKIIDTHRHTENMEFERSLCSSHEEVVYSGDANIYTYTGNQCLFFNIYPTSDCHLCTKWLIVVGQSTPIWSSFFLWCVVV